jgi:hypothetical protein
MARASVAARCFVSASGARRQRALERADASIARGMLVATYVSLQQA